MTYHVIAAAIIVLATFFAGLKMHKFYRLSNHQGIKYLRNGFWAFSFGNLIDIVLYQVMPHKSLFMLTGEFFLIVATLYILLSQVWKHYKDYIVKEILIFGCAAVLIAIDILWTNGHTLFISMISLMIYAMSITYHRYKTQKKQYQDVFFIFMVLGFAGWFMNYVTFLLHEFFPVLLITNLIVTTVVFLMFALLVTKIEYEAHG